MVGFLVYGNKTFQCIFLRSLPIQCGVKICLVFSSGQQLNLKKYIVFRQFLRKILIPYLQLFLLLSLSLSNKQQKKYHVPRLDQFVHSRERHLTVGGDFSLVPIISLIYHPSLFSDPPMPNTQKASHTCFQDTRATKTGKQGFVFLKNSIPTSNSAHRGH